MKKSIFILAISFLIFSGCSGGGDGQTLENNTSSTTPLPAVEDEAKRPPSIPSL